VVGHNLRMTSVCRGGEQVAGLDRVRGGVGPDVDPAGKRNRVLPCCRRSFLLHDHAGLDAARAADHTGHRAVVGCGTDHEFAGVRRVDADHHAGRGRNACTALHIEGLGEVGAAGEICAPPAERGSITSRGGDTQEGGDGEE
jgi:hypothetical protein